MVWGAHNSPPLAAGLNDERQLLANIEINNECGWDSVCSMACVLNAQGALARRGTDLSEFELAKAVAEIVTHSFTRYVVLAGKEPTATPRRLACALEAFHAQAAPRPALGMITSGIGLEECRQLLETMPLDFVNYSFDTADSGLRKFSFSKKALAEVVRLRERGGCRVLGVNSVATGANFEGLRKIFSEVKAAAVDLWTVSPFLRPHHGVMRPALSPTDVLDLINRATDEFTDLDIFIELNWQTFAELFEVERLHAIYANRWRYEERIPGTRITAVCPNVRRGFFARLRHDGLILDCDDFPAVGLKTTGLGQYHPGRLAKVLNEFASASARVPLATL